MYECMIYIHTKFHIPNSNGSTKIITMKSEAKENFRTKAML
jgi:hypothetical protein